MIKAKWRRITTDIRKIELLYRTSAGASFGKTGTWLNLWQVRALMYFTIRKVWAKIPSKLNLPLME